MKLFITLIAACITFFGISQDFKIGQDVKNIGAIKEVQILGPNEYIATSIKQRIGRNKIVLEHFVNNQKVKEIETPYRVNKSLGKFEDFILVDGKGFAFISDQVGKSRNLYIESLDLEDGDFGKAEFIMEDPLPRNRQLPSAFQFKISSNKKYVGIMVDISLKGDTISTYQFVVIDSDKNTINRGRFNLKSPKDGNIDFNFWVTKTGKIVAYHKECIQENVGLFKNKFILVRSHLYRLDNKEVYHSVLNNTKDDVAYEVEIEEGKDSSLYVHGFYQHQSHDQISNKIHGAIFKKFSPRLDLEIETYEEFPTEILLMGLTEEEVRKQRENLSMSDYFLRNSFIDTLHNCIIGVAEQYYKLEESYPDSRGYLRTETRYYYNDILSYRFNLDGRFEWINKAPKIQVTANDKGYYSSFFSYLNDNQDLVVIYNDDLANYLEDGDYIDPSKQRESFRRRSGYTTTKLTLDNSTGEKEYEKFITKFQRKSSLVPRLGYSNADGSVRIILIEAQHTYKFVSILD